MTRNTTIDYKNLIKKKFREEKFGEFHSFLDNPTPANLRELCLLKFDNGLNKTDEKIFRIYFKVNDDEDLRKKIFDYHIPNFKKIGNFLNEDEKVKNTNTINLNLISVLIDFNPRPYNIFFKNYNKENKSPELEKDSDEEKKPTPPVLILIDKDPIETPPKNPTWIKKNIKQIIGGSFLFITVFFGINYLIKDKKSIKWKKDHYELIDSKSQSLINEELLKNFKKIIPCDTTIYRKYGRACLWYGKSPKGEIEFFTALDVHPETGKTLKEVTDYIMNKYGKGPCK
ncbi:hypothetical protein FIA58_012420 [Flavobacterium jejuense]|uniref:Uncharacterized protein n=1 Tax=Flavobacterium jejuense TaxID=1544455 RepID=A0ABX0IRI1_9FLAO|nr:hypothetical protein [Flavobacterium jejuense]NHN26482.1 hypothetical protein [Flavobacterium jejuense]